MDHSMVAKTAVLWVAPKAELKVETMVVSMADLTESSTAVLMAGLMADQWESMTVDHLAHKMVDMSVANSVATMATLTAVKLVVLTVASMVDKMAVCSAENLVVSSDNRKVV